MFRYTTTKRSKFDSGEKQESRSHRLAGNLTFVFGIPNLRNAVCEGIVLKIALLSNISSIIISLFISLHLSILFFLYNWNFSAFLSYTWRCYSLIYPQCSHTEIREQPRRKSSFAEKQRQLSDYSDFSTKGVSSYFVFSLWKCSYLLSYSLPILPRRANYPFAQG